MKNRIKVFLSRFLYMLFNRTFLVSIYLLTYVAVLLPDYFNSDKKVIEYIFSPELIIIPALVFIVIFSFSKKHNILLSIHIPGKPVELTMYGIRPAKLRKYSDHQISNFFIEDFYNILKSKKFKNGIVMTTHKNLAKGAILVLYKMYGLSVRNIDLDQILNNGKCTCNGVDILIKKQKSHSNYMDSFRLRLTANQQEIDDFVNTKLDFYQISIPKELFQMQEGKK